jgi:hypothetical protein
MTQGESGPFTNHNMSVQEPSSVPIDEDPVAMQALFDTLRADVATDIDAYTAGEFDTHNFNAAIALGMTSLAIQEEFFGQIRREIRGGPGLPPGYGIRMRRAHEVMETVEIVNLSSRNAKNPTEAWEHGLTVATTARFRRELDRIEARSRRRAIGQIALGMRSNTGQ